MKHTKHIFWFCFFALLIPLQGGPHTAFASEGKLVPVHIEGTSFAINVPADWDEGPFSGQSILLSKSDGGKLYPNINVVMEEKKGRSLSQAISRWIAMLNDPQVFENTAVTVNGIPVHLVMASWNNPLVGGLKTLRLFVEQGDFILVISYVTRANSTTASEINLYLESLNSFRQSKQ
jgi:hypothetical protein